MNAKINKKLLALSDAVLNSYLIFALSLFITDYSFLFSPLHERFGFSISNINNISPHVFPAALLILFRWKAGRETFGGLFIIRVLKKISGFPDRRILWCLALLFFAVLVSVGAARHFSFSSSGIDMGVTDQAVWNTTRGNVLFSSMDGNINHLGAHFEPVLFLIAPLYLIWPDIMVLIVIQALALSLAVFPLYFIARERLTRRCLIFAFIVAYLLSRPLRGVGFFDFHTDCFFVPLIFAVFYSLIKGRNGLAVLGMFFMLLCKENSAFLIAGFGAYIFMALRKFRPGLLVFSLGLAFWFLITGVVMPRFAHTSHYAFLSVLPFGETYAENIRAVLNKPALLGEIFLGGGRPQYYLKMFCPLGFLSFLSWQGLVLLFFPLMQHLAVGINKASVLDVMSHYSAHTLPFVFISAVYGAGNLIDFLVKRNVSEKRSAAWISAVIILLSLAYFGKTDGYRFMKFINGARELKAGDIRARLAVIPEQASVSAAHYLIPHLSHRKYTYIWNGMDDFAFDTGYVVFHPRLSYRAHEGREISEMLSGLNAAGYKIISSLPEDGFYIFFNPGMDKSLVSKRESRVITIEKSR